MKKYNFVLTCGLELLIIIAGFLLGVTFMLFNTPTQVLAQTVDVPEYTFSTFSTNNIYRNQVVVKKIVYQGCELFVAVGGTHDSIALTTGRGCK